MEKSPYTAFFLACFETGFHIVAQGDPELTSFLPQSPKHLWNYRHQPPHPAGKKKVIFHFVVCMHASVVDLLHVILGCEPRHTGQALCRWATLLAPWAPVFMVTADFTWTEKQRTVFPRHAYFYIWHLPSTLPPTDTEECVAQWHLTAMVSPLSSIIILLTEVVVHWILSCKAYLHIPVLWTTSSKHRQSNC